MWTQGTASQYEITKTVSNLLQNKRNEIAGFSSWLCWSCLGFLPWLLCLCCSFIFLTLPDSTLHLCLIAQYWSLPDWKDTWQRVHWASSQVRENHMAPLTQLLKKLTGNVTKFGKINWSLIARRLRSKISIFSSGNLENHTIQKNVMKLNSYSKSDTLLWVFLVVKLGKLFSKSASLSTVSLCFCASIRLVSHWDKSNYRTVSYPSPPSCQVEQGIGEVERYEGGWRGRW